MGFLDKAKKLAEQAQTKLDEAQKQFNQSQPGGGSPPGPAVEYDKHGRPIPREEPVPAAPGQAPPHGDPLAGESTAPPAPPQAAAPAPPQAAAPAPSLAAPPVGPEGGVEEDRNHPSYAPPKLSSGDPLAP